MGAHLITGYAGKEHITAADQGLYNAGTLGDGKYVLPIGSMFEAVTITNNLVKIKDGCLVNQGRNINIAVNDYEECEIDNGIQALKRNDLIVIRYEKNADTGIETASTIVIKGVSGETAVDPEYTTGNIFNGDNVDDFPLYRVKLEGLNITAVEPLFNTMVSFKTLIKMVDSLNNGLSEKLDKATVSYFANTARKSISGPTWTAVNSITLEAGIYIIIHNGYTTGGVVRIGKGTNDGAWTASGGGSASAQYIEIRTLTKKTTISTYAYTEYTATDTVYSTIMALRVR